MKIANDSAVDSASAAPSAGARKGALQGVAATVARTPVRKEPVRPDFDCRPDPIPVAVRPNSNTPLMLSANASIAAASPKTNAGDCSWNPHPSWLPPARRIASRPARAQNESSTPAAKTIPWRVTFLRSAPAWLTKPRIFIPSTGKTHGMRLRMSPPTKARRSVPRRPSAGAAPGLPGAATEARAVPDLNPTSTASPGSDPSGRQPSFDVRTPTTRVASFGPSEDTGSPSAKPPPPIGDAGWGRS